MAAAVLRLLQLNKAVRGQQASMEDMVAKYRKESRLRKKLHNDLMELRGNIRVYARVRPVVKMEDKAGGEVVAEFPDKDTIAMVNSKRMKKAWSFDHVFKPEHTNSDVFEQCKDLLTSVVDGYNVCIFAYGQVSGAASRRLGTMHACSRLSGGMCVACGDRRVLARRTPWKEGPITRVSMPAHLACSLT